MVAVGGNETIRVVVNNGRYKQWLKLMIIAVAISKKKTIIIVIKNNLTYDGYSCDQQS